MRLQCWYCHKSVSSELLEDALFRAIAVCPECIKESSEAKGHPLVQQKKVMMSSKWNTFWQIIVGLVILFVVGFLYSYWRL